MHVLRELPMPVPRSLCFVVTLTAIVVQANLAFPQPEGDSPRAKIAAEHWAFRPIVKPVVPGSPSDGAAGVEGSFEVGTGEIDRFIARRLEREGLTPSPRADRRTLLRRLYHDLLGLPPTADDLDRFERDPSPDAFARRVDLLLASPAFGERWGRHWLDVARYSDTKGYVDAGERRYPFAYTYRDWVISALGDDVPFDRFAMLQIAADRLEEDNAPSTNLAALGFLTVGSRFNFFPHEVIDDRIDAVTRGFLGLTVACARCHDHKYDPISSADYYSLLRRLR